MDAALGSGMDQPTAAAESEVDAPGEGVEAEPAASLAVGPMSLPNNATWFNANKVDILSVPVFSKSQLEGLKVGQGGAIVPPRNSSSSPEIPQPPRWCKARGARGLAGGWRATCVVERELERCSNSNDPGTGLVTVRRWEVLAQENSH